MKLDAPVSSIMTATVNTVSPKQKLVDLKHLYEKLPFHHHVPVVEKNKLVGMVSLVDFMRAISNATLDDNEPVYQKILVKDIMSENPASLKSNTPIKKVAKGLAKGDVHAYVIADKGELKGIVSYSDIIKYLMKVLE